MRILLTGANGQVGHELHRSLAVVGQVWATDRQALDLTQPADVRDAITSFKPDLIVNAAAYTAVDKAEQEPELAKMINSDAPAIMAELAAKKQIPLIHYSTDYVFNGNQQRAWRETDSTDPLGVYGLTKLDGEQAVMDSGCPYLIFRTSWVYGTHGHNFMRTMQRLMIDREQLGVVDDQVGAPTWSRHIADVTAQVIAQSKNEKSFWDRCSGLYHLSAAGHTSWHGFAKLIRDELLKSSDNLAELKAITTDEYPTPAKRPAYSILDNSKLAQTFQLQLPDWAESFKLVIRNQ